jgi:hypothetical protein
MFLFNLDDKVFASIAQEQTNNFESSKIKEQLTTDLEASKSVLQVQKNNNGVKIEEKLPAKSTNPETIEYLTQKEKELKIGEELQDSTVILEKEKFHLEGTGDAWVKSKSSTIPIKINAQLIPAKGTNLQKFGLDDCEIIIGENIYNFNKGTVEIDKSKLTLTIIPNIENSIFFSMSGSFDFKIKNFNYSGKVVFEDESFYIYNEKKIVHLSYEAIITSNPD